MLFIAFSVCLLSADYSFADTASGYGDPVKGDPVKNIASRYFSLDFETANSDLGLGREAANYLVNLRIAPNEDAGSVNHFYFQLVFKTGNSSYVLANNYVPNDKFYPGHNYSFEISTNEDMGEVTAVNIIPDLKYENKDFEDNLIIEGIDIIKRNDNGIDNKYSITGINVIGLSSASQIAGITFPVDYSSECLCYEVALTSSKNSNSMQFEGSMLLDIGYKDIDGEDKIISDFDVVHAIYDYQKLLEPRFVDGKYVSNPETMFRGDLTDRFFVYIDNAKSLNYMNFRPMPTNDSHWNIKNLSVGIVNSKYTLHKNILGEYQNKYEKDDGTILIADKYTKIPNGDNGALYISFSKNEVPEITEKGIDDVVSRVPKSKNDKLNIFIYLDRESSNPIKNNFSIFSEVFYQGAYRAYSNKVNLRVKPLADGGILLYAYGVNAPDFISLSNMIISSDVKRTKENDFADTIDYAVIEQIRSNVVIDQYTVQYDHADIMLTGSCSMISAGNTSSENEYQEVGLSFGEGSSPAFLDPMDHDIAVSIKYTSKNDISGLNTVYSSQYIYLTDQGIKTVKAGDTVNLKFREGLIDKVVGLEIVATGGLNADIESGYIATYEDDGGKITGWYGIVDGGNVSLGGTTFKVSDSSESVKPVDINFITSETSEPVSVVINYIDKNGSVKKKELRNNISFENQTNTTISVLLPNLDEIRSIEIEPDTDLYVEEITTSVQTATGVNSRTVRVERNISSSASYTVNMSNIIVKASISSDDLKTKIENGEIDLSLKEGEEIEIKAEVEGSIDGFGYDLVIEKIISDETTIAIKTIESTSSSKSKGTIDFKVPKTEDNESYRITISSAENQAIKSTVNIYIKE